MTTLKLAGISLLVGTILGAYSTWVLQENKYSAKIANMEASYAKEKQNAATEYANATKKALQAERQGQEDVRAIQSKYDSAVSQLGSVQDSLNRLRAQYGGLYIESRASSGTNPTSPGPSSSNAQGNSSTTSTSCELSERAADAVAKTFADADEMRERLISSKAYGELINKWREENGNTKD